MPKRILIHDDEPFTLEYHVRILRDHGYFVEFIETEQTAFKVMYGDASVGKFNLLILDMLMPIPKPELAGEVENGIRTGRWYLREFRRVSDVPVLLFSRLDLDSLTLAAWEAYQSWRRQEEGADMMPPQTPSVMRKELIARFKVWIHTKNDTPPSDMVDIVKGIIGPP